MFRSAVIIAAKGGTLTDITIGDVLEILDAEGTLRCRSSSGAATFRMLREMGIFGPGVPTLWEIRDTGQRTVEELVDRYPIACRPVRDLIVGYLKERQPAIDYVTLHHRAYQLAGLPGDHLLAGLQLIPRPPMPSRAHRPDRLGDLPDQLISELACPAVAGQPRLCRRLHIPADGLAIHPGLFSDLAQACTRKPGSQHLTDLSHRNLPERHLPNPQVDRLEGIRSVQ